MISRRKEGKAFLNLHKRLETAIKDYSMIHSGDHVLVGLSGGKDSSLLLALLARKKVETTNDYRLSAIFVHMGFAGDDEKQAYLREYAASLNVPLYVVNEPVRDFFAREKKKPCYTCSRHRRLVIFKHAKAIGANVVAFGHHRDDFIETYLLNILYSGCTETIRPNNPFFGGEFRVIRPMLYIDEKALEAEARRQGIQTFPNDCPHATSSERHFVKGLIAEACRRNQQVRKSIFRAMFTVHSDYLLKPPSRNSVL